MTSLNATSPIDQDGAHRVNSMDRQIQRHWLNSNWKTLLVLGLLCVVAVVIVSWPEAGRSFVVDNSRLSIATVSSGQFDDFIPLRARVTPLKTVYLDAVEGGRIEKVHIEDGAHVEAGDLLVELSNTELQLDVISREAQVTEQLNDLLTVELDLERNKLQHKRDLVEIDYQLTRLRRLLERRRQQAEKGNIARADLEDAEDELAYYERKRVVTLNSQALDLKLQNAQMQQLRDSAEQLNKNLAYARRNLQALQVRAPLAGKVTAFNAEVGQSLDRGERLGQVDVAEQFKLVAQIDEFYLNRVDIEQLAELDFNGKPFSMRVSKIYSQVKQGRFEVDLVFVDEHPQRIKRGQTFQLRLFLGDASEAILIPNGAFVQDTGGKWIFVVTDDERQAIRRNLRLGRRNTRYIEVLEGLEPGERIITSPYTSYLDMQRLLLN